MAKRGRKKKFKVSFDVSPETYRSIVAVLLLVFSAIAFISFIAPDYLINSKIQLVFRKMFGYASILIPIITAISGLLFIEAIKARIKELRIIVGLVILLVSLSGFFHIFISDEKAQEMAIAGKGGGFLGYIISLSLERTISIYGGILVLLALIVVAVILTLNVSIDQIISFFKERLFTKELFKFRKKEAEDQIEIGSGGNMSSEDFSTSVKEVGVESAAIAVAEDFTIIPSLSEPQKGLDSIGVEIKGDSDKKSTSPSIPRNILYQPPPYDLLADNVETAPDTGDIEDNARKIVEKLKSFNIEVEVIDHEIGPTFTKYILKVPSGVRLNKISALQNDLALALASNSGAVRIEAPIPGKPHVGIELPNRKPSLVSFKSLIMSESMKNMRSKVGIVLGKDVGGMTHVYDIRDMPHMLVAGATGSGKSIFIHNIIFSILFRATPNEVKFILVDPKRVELKAYENIPHLLTPIVVDLEKVPALFKWVVNEMQNRYKKFEPIRAKNITDYNEKSGIQQMPYLVIIVEELGEIMASCGKDVESSIQRLGMLARAAGIHLIMAIQRPSADIVNGVIKSNVPCRAAFSVAKQIDSKVILDESGAEKLLGKGDMLFASQDRKTPTRLQSAFISTQEVENLTNYFKNLGIPADYKEDIFDAYESKGSGRSISSGGGDVDEKYEEALEYVLAAGKASATFLQRRLNIGFARAARILDEMYEKGVIGPANGARPRDVLIEPPSVESITDHERKPYEDEPKEEIV